MRTGGRKTRSRGRREIPASSKILGNSWQWLQTRESKATLHLSNKRSPSAQPEVPAKSTGARCASCEFDTNTRETARRRKAYARATKTDLNTCKPEASWQTSIRQRQETPNALQRIHAPAGSRS